MYHIKMEVLKVMNPNFVLWEILRIYCWFFNALKHTFQHHEDMRKLFSKDLS